MLRAIEGAGAVPLARAPWNDAPTLMRILDAGRARRHRADDPQRGRRARRGRRLPLPAGRDPQLRPHPRRAASTAPDYVARSGDEVLVFAMIETREALDDVEAICAVDGLSGVYVGPADLSYALGLEPRMDNDHPLHVAAVARILRACRDGARSPGSTPPTRRSRAAPPSRASSS